MKHIHTFESFLNESKNTWFPQAISILKDIWIGEGGIGWTSTGKNSDDFVIPAGEIITLSKDGTSNKNKEATYKVTVKRGNDMETDFMYFSLKEIATLIKQGAVPPAAGAFGHDITLKSMMG